MLAGRALGSLGSWARGGFGLVDEATYRRRIDACGGCPDFVAPPEQGLYRLAAGFTDARVCRLCGCFMEVKARLVKQHCPAADPADPTRTRWSELAAGHPRPAP